MQGITGIRLEVLTDKSLPKNGPGRAPNGNFVLNELQGRRPSKPGDERPRPIKLIRPQATFSQAAVPDRQC